MAPPSVRILSLLLAILFTMGSCLLLFFIVLAGTKSHGVLQKWYWLAADTSNTPGAQYPISRWSMYNICGYEKGSSVSKPGKFIGCTKNKPAYPLDPQRNFKSGDQTWDDFRTDKYYFMTRFDFAFYLIALFFEVLTLFVSLAAYCLRSLSITAAILQVLSFVFVVIAASLSTAAYNQGKSVFHSHGAEAKLGPALYGFAWAVVFMSMLNIVLFCLTSPGKSGGAAGGYGKSKKSKKSKGTPSSKRGGYRFGMGKKKSTQGGTTVVDSKDASSFVRA